MRNLICMLIPVFMIVSCGTSTQSKTVTPMSLNPTKIQAPIAAESSQALSESKEELTGGWVPVFFSWLDTKQLSSIAEGMNDNKIRRVVISYPNKMQGLAGKIQNYLQTQTKQDVEMQSIELKDTEQVSYNLTQVIVTLYFK